MSKNKLEKVAQKRGRGRPPTYGPAHRRLILRRLQAGQSLRRACSGERMPTVATVMHWCHHDPEFADQYIRARKLGYLVIADDIIDIADDGTNDTYVDERGNTRETPEVVARSRLRVDSRKWMLAKMLPKMFGDSVAITGLPTGGTEAEDVTTARDALLRRINRIAARVGENGGDPGDNGGPGS